MKLQIVSDTKYLIFSVATNRCLVYTILLHAVVEAKFHNAEGEGKRQ